MPRRLERSAQQLVEMGERLRVTFEGKVFNGVQGSAGGAQRVIGDGRGSLGFRLSCGAAMSAA